MTELRVSDVRRRRGTNAAGGGEPPQHTELSARIEGMPPGLGAPRLWFRVPAEYEQWIHDGAEPFVAALLPIAMVLRRLLRVDAPVSPRLLNGCRQIARIYRSWDANLLLRGLEVLQAAAPAAPRGTAAGCFFTAGVDSSYTLLKNLESEQGDSRITHLLFVRGYADCPLDNPELERNLTAAIGRIAAGLGVQVVCASTNLKDFTPPPGPAWDKFAGSQLAAIGHFLARGLRRAFIPASDAYVDAFPWGSHPLVDPLWSSENLEFRHDGCEAYRSQKLDWYVARSPLILENLRVCGYEPSGSRNCGRCEKCLRTMIALSALETPIPAGLFAHELDLARVRAMDSGDPNVRYYLEDNLRLIEQKRRTPELEAAVRAALASWRLRGLRYNLYAAVREFDRRYLRGRLRSWAVRAADDQTELRLSPARCVIREAWRAAARLRMRREVPGTPE